MNKLIIDTTDNSKTTVELWMEKKKDSVTEKSVPKSQITLLLVDKILKKNNLKPTEIGEIEVNTGPGSFTGTRVGVAIANALGFGLDVKVNGNKNKPASPEYF